MPSIFLASSREGRQAEMWPAKEEDEIWRFPPATRTINLGEALQAERLLPEDDCETGHN